MRSFATAPNREMADRLAQGFELFRVGVRMKRENFRRRYPEETAEEIEQRLSDWLLGVDKEPVASAP